VFRVQGASNKTDRKPELHGPTLPAEEEEEEVVEAAAISSSSSSSSRSSVLARDACPGPSLQQFSRL